MDADTRIDKYLSWAERVIALIRPKFYNRLTWVVVLAGLVLMASPWWLDLVNALATKLFGVSLPSSDAHLPWGFALVVSALVYHLVVHYVAEWIGYLREVPVRQARLEHDRQNFKAFEGVVREDELADFLSGLVDGHDYYSPPWRKALSGRQFLLAPSTQFVDPLVQTVAREFGTDLANLTEWLSLNFFPYGPPRDDGYRYCLYPDLNPDRAERGYPSEEQSRTYARFAGELEKLVRQTSDAYNRFRNEVKKTLAL